MIPNLSQVDSGVWRGGQPQNTNDWQWLWDKGIRQVIKLNEDSEGIDQPVEGTALFKVQIPLSQQIITEPDFTYLGDAVAFITEGTFVHCKNGWDRTGLVIGLYRVKRCGWTREQAWKEMLDHGFHVTEFGLVKAWEYLTGEWPVDPKPIITV